MCSAAFIGAIITVGIAIFNPILSEAMTILRRMLRIDNLSNPLLSKLSSEAPGTYHHSLNVSALAQKAAKAIGADSLLVRTAAYYHDIGKLENPTLYVENQSGMEIPTAEDGESIKKNAKEIISHVENGVKIAQIYKLPEEIIDLITEHHGTTKALYFYGKAKEKGLKMKRTDFKYPGPIPQSKESAILMLSDCVEATTRSMANLTSEQINEIVDRTIEERLNENQLKNSNLSEKDLDIIGKNLKENLRSIYHQRIEYIKK
ncbi:MAG: HDIG domain-containing protein, partial [Patescibacteria group bacterium]|nr:HDIG domain-containing protein [Patescibacteria group bacterium]